MSNYFFKCKTCGKVLKSTNYQNTEFILENHIEIHPELEAEYKTQNINYELEVAKIEKKYLKRYVGSYFSTNITTEEKSSLKKSFLTQQEILDFLKKGFQVHYYAVGFRDTRMRAELRDKQGECLPEIKINSRSIYTLLKKKVLKQNGERQVALI